MEVNITSKKAFLQWVTQAVSFNKREIYWLLQYLINHETILKNMHIVEHAEATPRGLFFEAAEIGEESLKLYIDGISFDNPDQIFHELRLNWKRDLFLTIGFAGAWKNHLYISVLEDNPYASWNDELDETTSQAIIDYLNKEEQLQNEAFYLLQINEALEKNEREAFEEWTKKLEEYKENQKKEK